MADFRTELQIARSKVHEHLSVRANLYRGDGETTSGWGAEWGADWGLSDSEEPHVVETDIRIQREPGFTKHPKEFAERYESNPIIVFEVSAEPRRGDVVCAEAGVAYAVHTVLIAKGDYVETECAMLDEHDAEPFSPPEA